MNPAIPHAGRLSEVSGLYAITLLITEGYSRFGPQQLARFLQYISLGDGADTGCPFSGHLVLTQPASTLGKNSS